MTTLPVPSPTPPPLKRYTVRMAHGAPQDFAAASWDVEDGILWFYADAEGDAVLAAVADGKWESVTRAGGGLGPPAAPPPPPPIVPTLNRVGRLTGR